MWTHPGLHEVCVTETNQDGCTGNPVCMEVFVEDDVWSVGGPTELDHLDFLPSVASDMVTVGGLSSHANGTLECWSLAGQRMLVKPIQGQDRVTMDVSGWASGQYLFRIREARGARRFTVQH